MTAAGDSNPRGSDASSDEHALAESFEALADAQAITHVLPPRERIFLPQIMRNRIRGFWWSIVRTTVFRWSLPSMSRWRTHLLRLFGAKITWPVEIAPTVRIEFPWNLSIGAHTVLCDHVIINCMGEIAIGERTRISQYSHIISGTHEYNSRDMHIERRPIVIGNDVWVAADAFVGPGVTLGDGCLLAARSSAFRDLPPGQVCVGEPAKPLHPRFPVRV